MIHTKHQQAAVLACFSFHDDLIVSGAVNPRANESLNGIVPMPATIEYVTSVLILIRFEENGTIVIPQSGPVWQLSNGLAGHCFRQPRSLAH